MGKHVNLQASQKMGIEANTDLFTIRFFTDLGSENMIEI